MSASTTKPSPSSQEALAEVYPDYFRRDGDSIESFRTRIAERKARRAEVVVQLHVDRKTAELQPPPVPVGLNIRSLPDVPFNVDWLLDFAIGTATDAEFRATIILLARAWHQVPAASLPDDDTVLARMVGKTRQWWRKIRDNVLRGWEKRNDGRLYHLGLAKKALRASAKQKQWTENRHGNDSDPKTQEPSPGNLPRPSIGDASPESSPMTEANSSMNSTKPPVNGKGKSNSSYSDSYNPKKESVCKGNSEGGKPPTHTGLGKGRRITFDEAIASDILDKPKMYADAAVIGFPVAGQDDLKIKFVEYHRLEKTLSDDWGKMWRGWCRMQLDRNVRAASANKLPKTVWSPD